jgi:hypothetical protein
MHRWQECIPVILDTDPERKLVSKRSSDALAMAWSLVPDRDRKLFHEFCCLYQQNDETQAAIERISQLVRVALDKDE